MKMGTKAKALTPMPIPEPETPDEWKSGWIPRGFLAYTNVYG